MSTIPCKVPNCEKEAASKRSGLCNAHYFRLRRHGSYELPMTRREKLIKEGKSYCPKCHETKPLDEFGKDIHTAFGVACYCKGCSNKKGKDRYKNNKRKHQDYHRKKEFGVTSEWYDTMFTNQDGKCAICSKLQTPGRQLSVDHCHMSSQVRGLLCDKCNFILGQCGDNIEILESAIQYLKCYR